jgi:hypothetical protein
LTALQSVLRITFGVGGPALVFDGWCTDVLPSVPDRAHMSGTRSPLRSGTPMSVDLDGPGILRRRPDQRRRHGQNAETTYTYGKDGNQPRTLTKVAKNYIAPGGAQVTAEAERLYELTGETKSVTSLDNGDKQELSWTYDGQDERITGQGSNGKSPYVGLADKCLDLWHGLTRANQPIYLHSRNASPAQNWTFTTTPGQTDADLGALTAYDNW